MTAPTLRVSSLRQTANSITLLDIEHLTLPAASTAVLGPTGAGTSALLRLLATVNIPTEGSIHLDGVSITDPAGRVEARRRLGYVPQHDGLAPSMRVHDYLDYAGALKEIPSRRMRRWWAQWALERVDLVDVGTHRISALTRSQQRRLTIAQALLGGPDYLVLDEPLAALDAHHQHRIITLLTELADDATIVVGAHRADELAASCRRIVVLDAGRIVFDGSPAALARRATTSTHCEAPTIADGYVAVVRDGA